MHYSKTPEDRAYASGRSSPAGGYAGRNHTTASSSSSPGRGRSSPSLSGSGSWRGAPPPHLHSSHAEVTTPSSSDAEELKRRIQHLRMTLDHSAGHGGAAAQSGRSSPSPPHHRQGSGGGGGGSGGPIVSPVAREWGRVRSSPERVAGLQATLDKERAKGRTLESEKEKLRQTQMDDMRSAMEQMRADHHKDKQEANDLIRCLRDEVERARSASPARQMGGDPLADELRGPTAEELEATVATQRHEMSKSQARVADLESLLRKEENRTRVVEAERDELIAKQRTQELEIEKQRLQAHDEIKRLRREVDSLERTSRDMETDRERLISELDRASSTQQLQHSQPSSPVENGGGADQGVLLESMRSERDTLESTVHSLREGGRELTAENAQLKEAVLLLDEEKKSNSARERRTVDILKEEIARLESGLKEEQASTASLREQLGAARAAASAAIPPPPHTAPEVVERESGAHPAPACQGEEDPPAHPAQQLPEQIEKERAVAVAEEEEEEGKSNGVTVEARGGALERRDSGPGFGDVEETATVGSSRDAGATQSNEVTPDLAPEQVEAGMAPAGEEEEVVVAAVSRGLPGLDAAGGCEPGVAESGGGKRGGMGRAWWVAVALFLLAAAALGVSWGSAGLSVLCAHDDATVLDIADDDIASLCPAARSYSAQARELASDGTAALSEAVAGNDALRDATDTLSAAWEACCAQAQEWYAVACAAASLPLDDLASRGPRHLALLVAAAAVLPLTLLLLPCALPSAVLLGCYFAVYPAAALAWFAFAKEEAAILAPVLGFTE